MQIRVVALLPEIVDPVLKSGVVGRAAAAGRIDLEWVQPRDYAEDRHRSVDDRPYGGGPGMVMSYFPLAKAIRHAREELPDQSRTVLLSAQGRRFDQVAARRLAALPGLVLVAGRYEGVDERLVESEIDEELSIGDYVLSGGELAAGVVIDAVVRLLPDVLGHPESALQDSFSEGFLDHPHYTRPEEIAGRRVPPELLTGNHRAVARWRRRQSLGRTWERRPDLLTGRHLDKTDLRLLDSFRRHYGRADHLRLNESEKDNG